MHNAYTTQISSHAIVMLPPNTAQASRLLNAKGVRATGARVEVLGMLLGSQQALSHLDIHAHLPDMDRVTLYRALDCLCSTGIAHKIAGEDRVFRYSVQHEAADGHSGSDHQHGHFQCTRCTRIFCLADSVASPALRDELRASLKTALGEGFHSHQLELTIKGWCADCSQ